MARRLLIAGLALAGTLSLEARPGPLETEEASTAARRAAIAAIGGPKSLFLEALDADGLLEKQVGPAVWRDLTVRQRDLLRSAAGERFLATLAPPGPAGNGVAWSAALPSASEGGPDALVGLRLGDQVLKTRWLLRRSADRWRIRDVVLSDPGISLAQATAASFGTRPLTARRGRARVLAGLLPPLAALLVIAIVVALAAPRLPPTRRKILYLAAAGAALVFLVAGSVAAARGFAHPYDLVPPAAGPPWREAEERAREAERAGRVEEARVGWERALRGGAPAGPVAYERGVAARQRGDVASARNLFESALAASPPSPGAGKELAALDASQGRLPEAERRIAAYLAAAGPDPEALTLAAVIATDLGKTAEAVASIGQARSLSADGSRGAELEAQIRARAGDAGGAVALLRPLALDRARLRADPAYLTIATDPAWVAFLNEKIERLKD
jgi:tetratricopeptide (TPR) repeat protein